MNVRNASDSQLLTLLTQKLENDAEGSKALHELATRFASVEINLPCPTPFRPWLDEKRLPLSFNYFGELPKVRICFPMHAPRKFADFFTKAIEVGDDS